MEFDILFLSFLQDCVCSWSTVGNWEIWDVFLSHSRNSSLCFVSLPNFSLVWCFELFKSIYAYFFTSLLNKLLLSVSSRISILDLSKLSEQDPQSSDSDENNVKILENNQDIEMSIEKVRKYYHYLWLFLHIIGFQIQFCFAWEKMDSIWLHFNPHDG